MRVLENAFWTFSLSVFQNSNVAGECIDLQDRHGIDVNVLLFCAWLGATQRAVDKKQVQEILASIGDWQSEVVTPLRVLRRRLKGKTGAAIPNEAQLAFREEVKRAELKSEQLEQAILYNLESSFSATPNSGLRLIAANIRTCLESKSVLLAGAALPEKLIAAASEYAENKSGS